MSEENNGWKPIETIPDSEFVDIWIKSASDDYSGRRSTDVCFLKGDGDWFGSDCPDKARGEYATHWRYRPKPPKE